MTAEQKALYRDVYHADRRQWQERLNQASGDVERLELQESAFSDKSAWGLGSAQCNVHPKVIQQAFRQGCKLPAYSDVFNDSEFFKTESLGTELLGGDVVLDGCQWSGRNVCRQSPDIAAIDRVVRILYKTTAQLGAATCRSCDTLLMLVGSGLKGPADGCARRRLFALVSDASFNPGFQDYTLCDVLGGHCVTGDSLEYPFEVRVASESNTLQVPNTRERARCFKHRTSDELAEIASGLAHEWRVAQLSYAMVSSMVMKVTGEVEPEEDPVASSSATDRQLRAATMVSAMSDPFSGPPPKRPSGRGRGRGGRGSCRSSSSRGAEAAEAAEAADDDDAPEEGSDADVASDAALPAHLHHLDADLLGIAAEVLLTETGNLLSDEPMDGGEAPSWASEDARAMAPQPPEAMGCSRSSSSSSSSGAPVPLAPAAAPPQEAIAVVGDVLDEVSQCSGIIAAEPAEPSASACASAVDAQKPESKSAVSGGGGCIVAPSASSSCSAEVAAKPHVGDPVPGGPEGWTMTTAGYCFDEANRYRCRLTTWSNGKSVSVYASGKKLPAFQRRLVTNGELLHWAKSDFSVAQKPVAKAKPKPKPAASPSAT